MASILSVAIGEIGYKEGNNNNTKYGAWYGANYQAWCAMFVSWCANQSGVLGSKVPKFAACISGREWYIKNSKFSYSKAHGGNYTPNSCDIIFFNWNKSKTDKSRNHVGIVERVDASKVYTVEGNTSDKVARRNYSLNDANIIGYGKTFLTYSANDTEKSNTYSTSTSSENVMENENDYNYELEHEEITVDRSDLLATYSGTQSGVMSLLLIEHQGKLYEPPVIDGIQLALERKGAAGKLTFSIVKDGDINFSEGDAVSFSHDGANLFYGWIFTQKQSGNDTVDITCYDQMRYLKNKDTYVYKNKTAAQLINMIAKDFDLQTGTIADTKFLIPSRIEDNTTLIDIIQTALDYESVNNKKVYVLYDNYGKLTLTNIEDMKIPLLIDEETCESVEYTSTIDEGTYNKIKLSYENEETGKRDIYLVQDQSNINAWGVLQYFDTLGEGEDGNKKANALLDLYNTKTRSLKIIGAFGDVRVRGGSMLIVNLNLGDIALKNYMLVEKCTHTFKNNEHRMNLILRGGDFVG